MENIKEMTPVKPGIARLVYPPVEEGGLPTVAVEVGGMIIQAHYAKEPVGESLAYALAQSLNKALAKLLSAERRRVLEEAAKVAEEHGLIKLRKRTVPLKCPDDYYECGSPDEIAKKIRALGAQEGAGGR